MAGDMARSNITVRFRGHKSHSGSRDSQDQKGYNCHQGCSEGLSAGVMVRVKCHSQVKGSWVTESDVTFRVKVHGPDQELQYGSGDYSLSQESQSDSGGPGD